MSRVLCLSVFTCAEKACHFNKCFDLVNIIVLIFSILTSVLKKNVITSRLILMEVGDECRRLSG